MKNLKSAQRILLIFGAFLVIAAFAVGFFSTTTHKRLKSTEIPNLPQGVHIPININTADKETLCLLEGIGEMTADKIINYREKGGFECIEDVMKVHGIGEKTFEKIKYYITT